MERLSWYLKRISVMESGEIRHRLGEQLRLRRLAAGQQATGHAAVPPVRDWQRFVFCTASDPVLPELAWDMESLKSASDGWRTGRWPAMAFDWRWRDEPEIWRRAPDTGQLWPQDFFADISYRAGNPYGDIRVAWEPARLQQLVALARLAQDDAGADEIAALIAAQLRSWVETNPPYRGIHYISAMECALRLIAACHALDLVRSRLPDPDDVWPALLQLVASHAPLIEQRLSLFSSRGNHTIAECAGLIYAGILFPELPLAARWKTKALEILAGEAAHQILPDGGGIERALHYHRFVVDLLGLVDGLLAHNGKATPAEITSALDRGRRFLAAVTLPDGETIQAADGDNGYALSRFLRLSAQDAPPVPAVAHFPETGYSILRDGEPDGALLLFDHGPLGMAPSFGHAHGDALSVALYRGGEAVLVDPGTYTYTGEPDWRRYFRSTEAHNTVCVGGRDQARQETAFQWSSPWRCRLVRSDESPDGIVRMLGRLDVPGGDGYHHLRGVAFAPGGWIHVWDRIEGAAGKKTVLHWHCGVAVGETAQPARFELGAGLHAVSFELRGGEAAPECVTGATEPPLGWRSPLYGRKEPCTVIRQRSGGTMPAVFETVIVLGGGGPGETTLAETVSLWQRWAEDAGTD